MKKWIVFVMLAVVVVSFLAVPRTGHARYWGWWPGAFWGGAFFGAALAYPYYAYPYRYYGYPYPYAYAQPPVYNTEPQQDYWYYCQNPQGYYPYVTQCPGGWMRVVPTPPQP
ncbi:MAG: hypothetical protein ABSC55_16385 [Syntrophorhabdales bacterium]|jgi:hypothetical protein